MTMFRKQFPENANPLACYGVDSGFMGQYQYFGNKGGFLEDKFGGDLIMAEQEESRTESTTVNEATGSSSKDERDDGNWLQLGVGGSTTSSHDITNKQDGDRTNPSMQQRTGLIELNLLPGGSAQDQIRPLASEFQLQTPMLLSNTTTHASDSGYISAAGTTTATATSLFLQKGGESSSSFLLPQHQEVIDWTSFRPLSRNLMLVSPSASPSSLIPPGSYLGRPFQVQQRPVVGVEVARPSFEFRIIDPPRRPHCGIWFMLQASQNKEQALILPQVPKSYLRIKDGKMTVRVLMKYLVNKLKLDNESEIEITCRGEKLQPLLTMQYVRDTIWSSNLLPRNTQSSSPSTSTATSDHIMVLQYARSKVS